MKQLYLVFAAGERSAQPIALSSLTPVGGRESSGIVIEALKHAGDYCILAPQESGIVVHPLRGDQRHTLTLKVNEIFKLDDLTLIVVPASTHATVQGATDLDQFRQILSQMQEPQNTFKPLSQLLESVMHVSKHEKGLVITKNLSGKFEILVSHEVDADESWLSESLVQNVLKEQKPAFVQNLIGSTYHSSQSLVATGLLSVFCWPLVVQGTPVGVLLTGSSRPHAGLSEAEQKRIETFAHLGAMIVNFRLRELNLHREIEQLRSLKREGPFHTQNSKLKSACELAAQVADSDLALLIQGETGVGKEVMASWIHETSGRKNAPFVAVNCSAIPAELLESLLFGHKKGSFTHAYSDQTGKIQQAHGGTLFLDEIGDLPLALQPKLLRVLNDKCVEPLGANKAVKVDVRLISASHKSLKELIAAKTFRDDLYYRLAEMTLSIPPLRERPSDILLIANQWLRELDSNKKLSEDARAWLMAQPWKGNVRELKTAIKRAVVLSTGDEIKKFHFTRGSEHELLDPTGLSEEKNWLGAENLEKAKQLYVRQKIHQALDLTNGNRTKAAQLLGVTARTLFRYLEDDGMTELS